MWKCMLLIIMGIGVGACQAPVADTEPADAVQATGTAAESSVQGGYPCHSDYDCNRGIMRTAYVCSNSGDTAGTCIVGCHSDCDCPEERVCAHDAAHWYCK